MTKYYCEYCDFRTIRKNRLELHLKNNHNFNDDFRKADINDAKSAFIPMKYLITNLKKINPKYNEFKIIKSIDEINTEKINESIFMLIFDADDEYIYHLEKIIKYNGKFITENDSKKKNYYRSSKSTQLVINNRKKLYNDLFFKYKKNDPLLSKGFIKLKGGELLHINICQALDITKNLDGCYVEIGVYTGGSGATALEYFKTNKIKKKCFFLDTFEGFDYDEAYKSSDSLWSEKDHNNQHKPKNQNYWMKSLNDIFNKNYSNIDFKIIKSNICTDNLPEEIDKISCANIDVDLLEATEKALQKISEKIVVGGIIIAEDGSSTPSLIGAFYAMEKFLKTEIGKKFIKINLTSQYFLIRIK